MTTRPHVTVRLRKLVTPAELADAENGNAFQVRDTEHLTYKLDGGEQQVNRFDAVYPPDCSDKAMASSKTVHDAVRAFSGGYNVTMLMYGQTGSEKTHTMDNVIRPAMGHAIFELASTEGFHAKVSCLQVYLDGIYDLLNFKSGSFSRSAAAKQRELHLNFTGMGFEVADARWEPVESAVQFTEMMRLADSRRKTAETNMNRKSSRSHTITFLRVSFVKDRVKIQPTLTLVDLAGSERVHESGVTGL